MMDRSREKGLTLIEMVVTMAIIGILISLALPNVFSATGHRENGAVGASAPSVMDRSREAVCQANLVAITEAVYVYNAETGQYPSRMEELVDAGYFTTSVIEPDGGRYVLRQDKVVCSAGHTITALSD